MDIVNQRLFEMWEYCEELLDRIFELNRLILEDLDNQELQDELKILRAHYQRARHRAETFKYHYREYRLFQ